MLNLSTLVYLITGSIQPRRKKRKKFRSHPNRSKPYLAWIRTLDCLVPFCEFKPIQAAHTGSDGGTGIKASDWSAVPLCLIHHALYHQIGKRAFAKRYRLNFQAIVERLNAIFKSGERAA
jgi:hypothetical protein